MQWTSLTTACGSPVLIFPPFFGFPKLNSFMNTAKSISKIYLEITLFSSSPLLPLSVGHHPLPPLLQYNPLLAGQSVLHIADEVIIFKYKSSNISLLLNFFSGFPCHSETTTKPAKLCTMNCKALHDLSCLCFQPHLVPLASTHSVLATRILFQFNSFAKDLNCLRL